MITAHLATIPERRVILKKVIDSIYNQVDKIILIFNGIEDLKPLITLRPKIEPHFFDNSLKDGAKFYLADHYPGYHLFVDDDILYPKDFVQRMIEATDHVKAPVSCMGKLMQPAPLKSYYKDLKVRFKTFGVIEYYTEVDIIGTCALAYHSKAIPDFNETFCTGVNSDIYFSKYCTEKGIKMFVMPHAEGWLEDLSSEIPDSPSVFGTYENNDKELTQVVNSFLK